MAQTGAEAIGSMGDDTPLAVLSQRPQLLYNYFKQLFAQVTNPPVDAIREELVMSAHTAIGPEANLLEATREAARQIKVNSLVLTNTELEKLRLLGESEGVWGQSGFKSITIPMLFDVQHGRRGLEWALAGLTQQCDAALDGGYNLIILSDREMNEQRAPIPALLAVSTVHHHLIRAGTRTRVGFVIESGEPREVHHFALLLGYGVAAVNPYLAFESIHDLRKNGQLPGLDAPQSSKNYATAIEKGVLKIMSKMGISTIHSYRGAQIFEALGLQQDLVDKYFTWTPTRIGGIGLDVIAEEALRRHQTAYAEQGQSAGAVGRGRKQSPKSVLGNWRRLSMAARRRGAFIQSVHDS